jgi:CRISPR-associated protein Cmr5
MNARQTRDQQRAQSAWQNVSRVPDDKGKEYGSLARGLASMIQTNGLGQSLAFLQAKAEGKTDKPHAMLFQHLSGWVGSQMSSQKPTDLLRWLITQNSDVYRRATAEALAYALWLRRFAEAKGWGDQAPTGG